MKHEDFIVIILLLLYVALYYLIILFFYNSLYKTLKLISPENRKMPPGQVWLNLIPLFNLVWCFYTVSHISNSIKEEFKTRSVQLHSIRPTYTIGITHCIFSVCNKIPLLNYLTFIPNFVIWIIYWNEITKYQNKLQYHTRFVNDSYPNDLTSNDNMVSSDVDKNENVNITKEDTASSIINVSDLKQQNMIEEDDYRNVYSQNLDNMSTSEIIKKLEGFFNDDKPIDSIKIYNGATNIKLKNNENITLSLSAFENTLYQYYNFLISRITTSSDESNIQQVIKNRISTIQIWFEENNKIAGIQLGITNRK